MAVLGELNQDYLDWLAARPAAIRELAERLPPNRLYRLKTSGHRVTIASYSEHEDGSSPTLQVDVTGDFNCVVFSRRVFGIKPEDLEECDLPAEGELLGDFAAEAGYNEDDVKNILIPAMKAAGLNAPTSSPPEQP